MKRYLCILGTILLVFIVWIIVNSSVSAQTTDTCYGVVSNIYSPDNKATQSINEGIDTLGRASLMVDTSKNTLQYSIGVGVTSATEQVSIYWGGTSRQVNKPRLEVINRQNVWFYDGTLNYQENQESEILFSQMDQNYVNVPVSQSPLIIGKSFFGGNFTRTLCNRPLFPTTPILPSLTPSPPVVWMATHELGTDDEWRINDPTATAQDSQYCARPIDGVSDEIAHNGKYSLKMLIDTKVHHAGCRTFRYPEARNGNAYYYSAWFYLPERYIIYGGTDPATGLRISGWTNLMQFKAKREGQSGGSDLFWSVGMSNRSDGTMYLFTKWDDTIGLPGPSSDYLLVSPAPQQFHQNKINIYPRKWFHLEIYLRQNTLANYNGRITVWQDGTEIFDMSNIITKDPRAPSFNSVSMNAYAGVVDNLDPSVYNTTLYPRPYIVYVDDAVISTQRIGPGCNQPGDTNHDCIINADDVSFVNSKYGTNNTDADLDSNSKVNIIDVIKSILNLN